MRPTVKLKCRSRLNSDPQNLPISPDHFDRLPELVNDVLPLYGHHVRLLRLYGRKGSGTLSREATTRYYDSLCAIAIPLMTALRHLDVSVTDLDAQRTNLEPLSRAVPVVSTTLTTLTLSGCNDGVPVGALLEQLPLLTTLRLSWSGFEGGNAVASAFLSLHRLESLRLSMLFPEPMRRLRFSRQAPLSHLDLRQCGIDLHDLQSIIATHQQTLTSLVLCDKFGTEPSRPPPTLHLPHLRDLSFEHKTLPDFFTSSPLRTLRCLFTPDDSIESFLHLLDHHRSTLKKVRVCPTRVPGRVSSPLAGLEEVEAVCQERGIDFAQGSWIVDEWEEHFGKWM